MHFCPLPVSSLSPAHIHYTSLTLLPTQPNTLHLQQVLVPMPCLPLNLFPWLHWRESEGMEDKLFQLHFPVLSKLVSSRIQLMGGIPWRLGGRMKGEIRVFFSLSLCQGLLLQWLRAASLWLQFLLHVLIFVCYRKDKCFIYLSLNVTPLVTEFRLEQKFNYLFIYLFN